jgi:hypothetical protein
LSCTGLKDTESKISYKASENESFVEHAILIASEIEKKPFQYTRKDSVMVWSVDINTSIRIFSLHGKDEGCRQEVRMDTNSEQKTRKQKRR